MKKDIRRIIVSVIVLIIALTVDFKMEWINTALFIVSYLIVGGDIVIRAGRNIVKGKVFDENFLMAVATIGAMLISEYAEGIAVMLFYQIGELFQGYAVNQSRKSIAALMDIRPDYANLQKGDEIIKVDPDEVKIGDVIVIKAGERVPLDGRIIDGYSMIDTSALTGESVPREVKQGDEILSGCININGRIMVEVGREYEDSTVSKILELVESASSRKSQSERFITKFARYYTPIVVVLAVLLALLPPLLIPGEQFSDWIYRSLSFLVVSCPCALVISIPLTFFSGMGGASKQGILVKGGNYLEALAKTEIVVFDKTGTLTKGVFEVQEIYAENIEKEELLELAAYAESNSNHPISKSILRAYGREIDNREISEVEEISGFGVSTMIKGRRIHAGNSKLMKEKNIRFADQNLAGTIVHVAVENEYAGYILIADKVKEDSGRAVHELREAHVKQIVMLTGDNKTVGEKVASELNLDQVYSELLPGDKLNKLEEIFAQKGRSGKIAFVGDGMNDAPVLARADVGIAMGGVGSDAAIEAADVVIMTDEPSKVAKAIRISRRILKIAHQNIVLAIGVKIGILILSALGITTMWIAIFGDVGVTIIAILNSFRALKADN